MLPVPSSTELVRRVPRLLVGLVFVGLGLAFTVVSEFGLSPWEVFHQGISRRTGVPLGMVGIAAGALVLFGWIPLREKIGIGTLLNVMIIGVVIDTSLLILPEQAGSTVWRWVSLLGGIGLVAIGTGLYIGAGLGSGPRDGLMTGLARRGYKIAPGPHFDRDGRPHRRVADGWNGRGRHRAFRFRNRTRRRVLSPARLGSAHSGGSLISCRGSA